MEVIHIFCPSARDPNFFLTNHTPQPNTYIFGVLNSHHTMWYGKLAADPRIRTNILRKHEKSELLVDYAQ